MSVFSLCKCFRFPLCELFNSLSLNILSLLFLFLPLYPRCLCILSSFYPSIVKLFIPVYPSPFHRFVPLSFIVFVSVVLNIFSFVHFFFFNTLLVSFTGTEFDYLDVSYTLTVRVKTFKAFFLSLSLSFSFSLPPSYSLSLTHSLTLSSPGCISTEQTQLEEGLCIHFGRQKWRTRVRVFSFL